MEKYLEVGQIVSTYGIKGFVKVNPFTDEMSRFEELKNVYIVRKDSMKNVKIEEVKYSKNQVLLKIEGINTIEEAEKYRNCILKIDRKDAKKLPEGTYFIADLLDSEVYTEENEYLGKVDDIFPTGSNDVYVIKNDLGKQILLPGIGSVIKDIDIENKKITVHLLEGLI